MKIGILGSGVVGQALGLGFAGRGHQVVLGTRSPGGEGVQAWREKAGPQARVATFQEAAEFGEAVVLATSWTGTQNALDLAGAANLAGKVVLDVTNPLDFSQGAPRLALGHTDSGGEQVQRWLPDSRVVKVFNIITAASMVDPAYPDGPPTMFIAGNDDEAKALVTRICHEFGWSDVVDTGGMEGARLLEPLAQLWISHGIRSGAWTHAFRLLRK